VGGANKCILVPAKIRRWLIKLYLAYISDNKLIIYRFKRGFFERNKQIVAAFPYTDNSISYDLPCDLPCAALPANHRPAKPRAQRTNPQRIPSGYS